MIGQSQSLSGSWQTFQLTREPDEWGEAETDPAAEVALLCGARGGRITEQVKIRMEVNNRYSCAGKNWFGGIKLGDYRCGRYLAPLYALSFVGLVKNAHILDRHP